MSRDLNKNTEKPEKHKVGPPNKNKERDKKKVEFTGLDEEIPSNKGPPSPRAKERMIPYVDVPPLKATVRKSISDPLVEHQTAKIGSAYKSKAPVEIGIDIEGIVERVLDLEISVPLRNLAGISGAVQKEIRKQVTKSRMPVETGITATVTLQEEPQPMIKLEDSPVTMYAIQQLDHEELTEGTLVAGDPVLQYMTENKDVHPGNLIVADVSTPLRAIYMHINRVGQAECLIDPGSMIVSMSKAAAVQYGLNWDPALSINMESASNHVEKTLGLAKNVRFEVAEIVVFLQVHILGNPPYQVLLGKPFEACTGCHSKSELNGYTELVLTDPNTKAVATVPTYKRGCGPEELQQKQTYQGF